MTLGPLLIGIYVFVLAGFVGFEMITKVPPTLHTPLMSGANAISGITVVGAIAAATTGAPTVANILGALAIITATINVVGGFLVTDRMLRMFGKKKPKALKPADETVAAQGREAVRK
ncbi:MAG: NAD(P) transhydrogenase subunit alpha [Polyangiales bacterium]